MPLPIGMREIGALRKEFYIYILASRKNGALYTGVTATLPQRIWEHRTGAIEGFTKKYNIRLLVYFEPHDDANSAFAREKLVKRWRREWKIAVIERRNPDWEDLYPMIAEWKY
jgi:putative endonuclease